MLARGCLAPGCVKPAGDCEKPPAQKLLPVAFAPPPLPSMGGGAAFRLAISVYETLCPRDCRPPPLGCWNPEGAPPLREPPKPGLDVGSAPIDAVLLSGLGAMRGAVRGAAWEGCAKPPGDGTPRPPLPNGSNALGASAGVSNVGVVGPVAAGKGLEGNGLPPSPPPPPPPPLPPPFFVSALPLLLAALSIFRRSACAFFSSRAVGHMGTCSEGDAAAAPKLPPPPPPSALISSRADIEYKNPLGPRSESAAAAGALAAPNWRAKSPAPSGGCARTTAATIERPRERLVCSFAGVVGAPPLGVCQSTPLWSHEA